MTNHMITAIARKYKKQLNKVEKEAEENFSRDYHTKRVLWDTYPTYAEVTNPSHLVGIILHQQLLH